MCVYSIVAKQAQTDMFVYISAHSDQVSVCLIFTPFVQQNAFPRRHR